jgi:hypothetical protein
MAQENYISIKTFCEHHGVQESFVFSMQEFELLRVDQVEEEVFIPLEELPILEKMVRLHRELDINPEGIQAVYHLLEQVRNLQQEVATLRRKLDRLG